METPLIVLAGGFGTRLSAVVKDVPKPLAPVADKPFLYHLIQSWKNQGLRNFVFLIHYRADQMESFLQKECDGGILSDSIVDIVHETEALGTGGAVANAVNLLQLDQPFLVANADTYMENGIEHLLQTGYPAIATIDVEDAGRYGSVKIKGALVRSFEEKNPAAGPGSINAGLYYLHPSVFENWNGKPFSMEKDIFEKMVETETLRSVSVDSVFIDIGIPEDYHRFCNWIESGKKIKL